MNRDQMLTDRFGRQVRYLRISVTDRCDLRCRYCLPKGFSDFSEPEAWLRPAELERIVTRFARMGVSHLRLTGGEPLVRRNIVDLTRRLAAIPGIDDLSLSTNGARLAGLARPLHDAGVRRINVSLDSLNPETYAAITGGGKLEKVLQGLQAAKAAGIAPIKLNTVVMGGVNEGEIEEIFEFAVAQGYALRLIETMPVGATGQDAVDRFVDLETIRRRLTNRYELIPDILPGPGPARYYRVAGSDAHIGFITPMSQHFCETCNRVRLSVEGDLYACLGDEHRYPLRPHLRAGCGDQELSGHLLKAVALKPERHEFNDQPTRVVRFMSMTGG
ncbi:MAG: GTP 3',8-cyclase MoaA [Candidatus Thiodiazotropha sp.]|jgi:GTP 3',8-cyclase